MTSNSFLGGMLHLSILSAFYLAALSLPSESFRRSVGRSGILDSCYITDAEDRSYTVSRVGIVASMPRNSRPVFEFTEFRPWRLVRVSVSRRTVLVEPPIVLPPSIYSENGSESCRYFQSVASLSNSPIGSALKSVIDRGFRVVPLSTTHTLYIPFGPSRQLILNPATTLADFIPAVAAAYLGESEPDYSATHSTTPYIDSKAKDDFDIVFNRGYLGLVVDVGPRTRRLTLSLVPNGHGFALYIKCMNIETGKGFFVTENGEERGEFLLKKKLQGIFSPDKAELALMEYAHFFTYSAVCSSNRLLAEESECGVGCSLS